MTSSPLVEESYAIVEYSDELVVAVQKLKLSLDIERIAVLKLLVACIEQRESQESGIILVNNTQYQISIKDQFSLGFRKFTNVETISPFQKIRWVSIAQQNVQNTLLVKVFEFDEFQLKNFHTNIRLLLFDCLVEPQSLQIELHSFKTQQLLTLIVKASFDFNRACFDIEFCEHYLIQNMLSNQYSVELGSKRIESKGSYPFSAIRNLRQTEPKLLHERLTLRSMNLSKIHETELKSYNLSNIIARKERVPLSHNILLHFKLPSKKGDQEILEIKPRFMLSNLTSYDVDVCSLKKCKFQTCKANSEHNFCDFPFDVADLDDKIQLLLKKGETDEVYESKYQAQITKLLSEELVEKIGFKFVNRDKTKTLWLRMEREVVSEHQVKLKLVHSFTLTNKSEVPFFLIVNKTEKVPLKQNQASITDSFNFFDLKTKVTLGLGQSEASLISTSEFSITNLEKALIYLRLMSGSDEFNLFSLAYYHLQKPGVSELSELIHFEVDPRIKGQFKLLVMNKGAGLQFFSSSDFGFLSAMPNFMVLSKNKAQPPYPLALKQQSQTIEMINKFFQNCENCFLLYFEENEFKAISSAFEPGYQHRYALDFLVIANSQSVFNFQFLMKQSDRVSIEVTYPNIRLLPQNCFIKLDLTGLKGKEIELEFDLDKENSLREKFFAQVGQQYTFFWHLSSLQNGYLYFWVRDKATKQSSYVVADFNHQPFFVYKQHGFKVAYFTQNSYQSVSFLPLQHSEMVDVPQAPPSNTFKMSLKISVNEVSSFLSIIPKTLTPNTVFIRFRLDKLSGMYNQHADYLQFELDAARVTISDEEVFEDGIQRSLSSIGIMLPKFKAIMQNGSHQQYHREWNLLVREVNLDIRDRLLLVLSYFSKLIPQANDSSTQGPPSLIEKLKVSQVPVKLKVMLSKLSPQLRVNETEIMIDALNIEKGNLLMTFEQLQNEAINVLKKSIRAQASKVIMNSNYLGELGASLKDSKSSYEEGSYVKPIYFLGKGAASAIVGFFSSTLTMGWEINVSGKLISPRYYSAIRSFYSIIKPPQPQDKRARRSKEEGVDISDWSVQKFNTLIFQQETLKVKASALFPMTAHTIRILEAIQKGIIPQQKVFLLLTDACVYLLQERAGGQEHDLKRLPSIVKISDLSSVSVKKVPGSDSKVLILESLGDIKVIVQMKEGLETMDLVIDFLTV